MLTILHYIPSIDQSSGGVGAYMQLLARDLGKLCNLHVLTHESSDQLELENCTLHYIPYKWLPWNNCCREFLAFLEQIHPDVFHTNCCWMPVSALTAIWAKEAGYRVVYTPHGMLEPWIIARNRWKKIPAIWLFQRKGLHVCDLIHATSELERENLLSLGWNRNVCNIPNCVQLDKIPFKSRRGRSKTILFLSRIHPKKGIPFLIDSVATLREELNDYHVRVIGQGDENYIRELTQQIKTLGVEDIMSIEPPVFGDEKWKLFADADLFVLPTYSENFGIVVAEALACGTPVITTKGTPWEELETCGCGWWIDLNHDSLVSAMSEFLEKNDDELYRMGENGRWLIERKYSSEAVAQRFISLYMQLLNRELE